jgi:hypothetical protein
MSEFLRLAIVSLPEKSKQNWAFGPCLVLCRRSDRQRQFAVNYLATARLIILQVRNK